MGVYYLLSTVRRFKDNDNIELILFSIQII